MSHHPNSLRRQGRALAIATGLSLTLLAACSSKPPGCSDEKTVSLVKTIILDQWKELTTVNRPNDEFSPYVTAYANGLQVEVNNVVSDGYNDDARKHSCTGAIVLKAVTGASFSGSRTFTSQATAEGNGKFVVQVSDVDTLVRSLVNDLLHYMGDENVKRLTAAKKAEALSSPPPAERELSISPIAETTPSTPPSAPTAQQTAPSPQAQKVESQGPSFDCTKAATAVERAICGDPKLSELDVAVVKAYNVALSKLPNKQDARTEQGQWMRQVRNACTSVQCLTDAYQRRLAQLQ